MKKRKERFSERKKFLPNNKIICNKQTNKQAPLHKKKTKNNNNKTTKNKNKLKIKESLNKEEKSGDWRELLIKDRYMILWPGKLIKKRDLIIESAVL